MLNKKLNPTGPKNKKFVINLHICKGKKSKEKWVK
jgi:hypothetical protein